MGVPCYNHKMNKIKLSTGQILAYDQYGSNEATPAVLLHGLSSNRRIYNHLANDLSDRLSSNELQLINVDLRGHGESSHGTLNTYDAVSYASDIAELIEKEIKQPAIIIAESLGGVIGAVLAKNYPELVKGIFMEDPPLFLGEADRLSQSPISSDFPQTIAAVKKLQANNAPLDEYENLMAEAAEADELADLAIGLPDWDSLTMQAAVDGILWRNYDPNQTLSCQVTIVRADPEEGAAFDEQDVAPMQAANPSARIVMIPGASHSVRSSQPELYAIELDKFLDTVL